jgi:hypothetical protein
MSRLAPTRVTEFDQRGLGRGEPSTSFHVHAPEKVAPTYGAILSRRSPAM